MKPRSVALVSLGVALLIGFFVSGHYMYRTAIGLDPAAFPGGGALQVVGKALFPGLEVTVGGLVLSLGTILLTAVAVFFVVRHSVRANRGSSLDGSRRTFLTGTLAGAGAGFGALVLAGAGAFSRFAGVGNGGRGWVPVGGQIFGNEGKETHPEWIASWKGSRVQNYRRLGRTDFEVSDIVMGTGPLEKDASHLVELAVERGVNYIDTSPDYSAEGSETAVGKGLSNLDRSKIFLATKFCTPTGHLPTGTPVEVYKENVEGSLRRLGVDYVDLIHVHSCDEVDRLLDENMHEAFDRLKAEGKARFLGFSSHTPNLVQVSNAAIESGRFDVMMLAYHHGIWSKLGDVIKRARSEQDMGVVAMKTLKGAQHHDLAGFQAESDAYSQAALKWVLENPDVSCAVISMVKAQHIDEYLYASGRLPTAADLAILQKYDQQIVGTYCAPHCGACLSSCPEGVPIHDVLRHRMYFENYGWEKEAMRLYSRLETRADACASCAAPCLGSCPLGIPIPERTQQAHELLTLS